MPEKKIIAKARQDRRQGKSASTQAGEFVKEEIHRIRQGKHGARSTKQAIAIGLSEARKAGVPLPPAPSKKAKAKSAAAKKTTPRRKPSSETSPQRAAASLKALRREPTSTVSSPALAKQAHESAARRGPQKRKAAAQKAVHTKGSVGLHLAAKKAAQSRRLHAR